MRPPTGCRSPVGHRGIPYNYLREPRAREPSVQAGQVVAEHPLEDPQLRVELGRQLGEDRRYASMGVPSPRSRWLRRPVRRSFSLMGNAILSFGLWLRSW